MSGRFGQDADAIDYFSEHCPEYPTRRLRFAIRRLSKLVPADAAIADVGCGTGNVLRHIRDYGGFTNLTGFDPSPEMVEIARKTTGCDVAVLSVLDDAAVTDRAGQFDVVVLAAVLHHLVGSSRKESVHLAERGLRNAFRLVRRRGFLVIVEPTYEPEFATTALFYLKRLVTRFTSNRVELGGALNNIGAPVVSFLSHAHLLQMASDLDGAVVRQTKRRELKVGPLMRVGAIRRRDDTTIILRKRRRRAR